MKVTTLRDKLMDEISKIPDDKVPEVFDFLHHYRLGLGTELPDPKKTLQLAGSWSDMAESDFNDFLHDAKVRRKNAFTSRRNREAGID